MLEKGIRGGISQAVKRYAKANNKYMKDLYTPDEESIYLQYVDANNLYGWAMVQNLPTHGFLWKEAEDFTPEKIEKRKNGREQKLVPNLKDKKVYVVHIQKTESSIKAWFKI